MAVEGDRQVVFTGCGMVTALGLDVRTCCAAARAGLGRPASLDSFPVLSAADGEPEPAVGHAVPLVSGGFEGEARIVQLVAASLRDLMGNWDPGGGVWTADPAFYLVLPNPLRVLTGFSLDEDEEVRGSNRGRAAAAETAAPDRQAATRVLQHAARLAGWPREPRLDYVSSAGNDGFGDALSRAQEDLMSGRAEIAVVAAADSFLDEGTLDWLSDRGRLKTPTVPEGLSPGEGAAALSLETLPHAEMRHAGVLGVLRRVSSAVERSTLSSEDPPLGRGVEEAILGLGGPGDGRARGDAWVIVDLNGEPRRAMEWGHALVRLRSRGEAFAAPALWYPAASFGDTGAASGAIAACVALSAFKRGYAPSGEAILLSISDGPTRSAVWVASGEAS